VNSPLWSLIPDSAIPLIVVVIALAVMIRVVKPCKAVSILGFILLSVIATPFINAIFAILPLWLYGLLLVGFFFSLLRAGIQLLIGRQATNHMVGALATDLVRLCLRIIFFPFQLLGRRATR
jgi:hypothetical protein